MVAMLLAMTLWPGPTLAREPVNVVITGVSGELLTNVQASLAIERRRSDENLDAMAIRKLHERADNEIHRALEPFGYYRPDITAALFEPDGDEPWQASYTVNSGPQIPLGLIDVQLSGPGATDSELATLSNTLPLRDDIGLDHRRYEATRNSLLKQIREHGYLDANYTAHAVEVDLSAYSASVSLHIDTGPRFVFGAIALEQERFAPEYLERYLILQPGETFSQARLSRQRAALSRSGHFQEVTVELGEPGAGENPAIPVSIHLTPYKNNRYRGRIGWGTDTGFGLQADWTRRQIGKHGHRFTLGGTVVEERNRLAGDLSYIIPQDPLRGSHFELGARHESKDLTYEDVDLDEGGETRIETNLATLTWQAPGRQWRGFDIKSVAGVSLVNETYDVFEVLFGNLPSKAQDELIGIIGNEGYATLAPDFEAIAPGLALTLRRTDNPLYIRRGDYLNLQFLVADESMGSNISFWQTRLNTWNIWPMGGSGRLLVRSALGYSDAKTRSVLGINFNQMPEYYEFRAGGARSVRGYAYESLFPRDTITGGKHQIVASVEYEHEVIPDWSAAIFLDGGNAFNDFDEINEKLGAGIGVRWRSPVGLARIDLGFPLDKADESFQIYITVGPEF
jgi:translocation and assembly module TamA